MDTFSQVTEFVFTAIGLVIVFSIARFGWELASSAARMITAKIWPVSGFSMFHACDSEGRSYRYFRDDWGRICYVERRPELDEVKE